MLVQESLFLGAMNVFIELYTTLFPYLLCILLGYGLRRKMGFRKSFLTKPLLLVLLPILVISHVLEAEVANLIILSMMMFSFSAIMNLPAIGVHKWLAPKESPSFLRAGFSYFNVAFFGIPTVQGLFGESALTALICIYIGSSFYGNVFGYFQVAKSRFSTKKAIKEVFKIPFIYVFFLAISLKIAGVQVPKEADLWLGGLGQIVAAGGMMLIGMNVAHINFKKLEWPYYVKILSIRLLCACLIMVLILTVEYLGVHGLSTMNRQILILLPFFPIAANLSVFASFLRSNEQQAGLLVLFSMLLSLIMVPCVAFFF